MPIFNKVEARNFYDFLPSVNHRTGDIWRNLPSFGLFKSSSVDGIVVTPACDLANRKCETVTYLPILSIEEYLASPSCRYECWIEVQAALRKLKLSDQITSPNRFELAILEEFKGVVSALSPRELETPSGKQVAAYLQYLQSIESNLNIPISIICRIFSGSRLRDCINRIIVNSFKTDIHFLPADEKPSEYSAIKKHSLAVFRYPITIPIEILDLAQYATEQTWPAELDRVQKQWPSVVSFQHWPVKLATLKDDFLTDMVSRYVSMYIRLGSRDFSPDTVEKISSQIIGD